MNDFLILKFNAPLISFGGVAVDNKNPVSEAPAKSLVTGLIANALGYEHKDSELIEALQKNISFAAITKNHAQNLQDFQTVDLSQDFLTDTGWTTRGKPIGRAGGNSQGTHIRYRHYWVNGTCYLAVTSRDPKIAPTLNDIESAMIKPERPLFIGRKCCLPSDRIFQKRLQAQNFEEAFILFFEIHPSETLKAEDEYTFWQPLEESLLKNMSLDTSEKLCAVTDERDWKNQIHSGRRLISKEKFIFQGKTYD